MNENKGKIILSRGFKHYFIVEFPQRIGVLKEFVTEVMGENDDIIFFQFSKKNHKEHATAIVGVKLQNENGFNDIEYNLNSLGFEYKYLNEDQDLYNQLIG